MERRPPALEKTARTGPPGPLSAQSPGVGRVPAQAVEAGAVAPVTGNRFNTSVGNVTTIGNAVILPNGSQLNLGTGTVTISADANLSVTGNRVNLSIGNATAKANATAIVTGNRYNLSSGTVTIVAKANIIPTGSQLNVGTTQPNVRLWNPIDPSVGQVWTRISTP